jgi:hypothetical protein
MKQDIARYEKTLREELNGSASMRFGPRFVLPTIAGTEHRRRIILRKATTIMPTQVLRRPWQL